MEFKFPPVARQIKRHEVRSIYLQFIFQFSKRRELNCHLSSETGIISSELLRLTSAGRQCRPDTQTKWLVAI